jgi:hypothetical protein
MKMESWSKRFQPDGAQERRELVTPRFEFAIRSLRDVGD